MHNIQVLVHNVNGRDDCAQHFHSVSGAWFAHGNSLPNTEQTRPWRDAKRCYDLKKKKQACTPKVAKIMRCCQHLQLHLARLQRLHQYEYEVERLFFIVYSRKCGQVQFPMIHRKFIRTFHTFSRTIAVRCRQMREKYSETRGILSSQRGRGCCTWHGSHVWYVSHVHEISTRLEDMYPTWLLIV